MGCMGYLIEIVMTNLMRLFSVGTVGGALFATIAFLSGDSNAAIPFAFLAVGSYFLGLICAKINDSV